MTDRAAVLCESCGHPYSARLIEGEVVVSTDDGRCACGNGAFVEIEADPSPREKTTG